MMEPLISVIVPVYKVEAYLCKCVDSVLEQTYRNLEIILVDDGSPDRCGEICDEYAKKDKRVRVIHKVNGGLSDARNAGMNASVGDYLMFVDSDDWLLLDSVEYLYNLLKCHNAQLAIGGRERIADESGAVIDSEFTGTERVQTMNCVEAMRDMLTHGCASWARLYKREVHIDVLFPVGEINEDEAIVLQLLNRCTTVVRTNRIVYQYRCREESITTTNFSRKKLIWKQHCAENLTYIQGNYPELALEAAARYRGSLLWSLTEMAYSDDDYDAEASEVLVELRSCAALLKKAPFVYWKDRVRFFLLQRFPFDFYRKMCRLSRRGMS